MLYFITKPLDSFVLAHCCQLLSLESVNPSMRIGWPLHPLLTHLIGKISQVGQCTLLAKSQETDILSHTLLVGVQTWCDLLKEFSDIQKNLPVNVSLDPTIPRNLS